MADTFEDVLQIPEGATGELPQLVLQAGFQRGLLAGCGMGKEELNAWAVMNYSMEDRGIQPAEPHVGLGLTQRNQTDRFLNGDLSYFGVSICIRNAIPCMVHLELGCLDRCLL